MASEPGILTARFVELDATSIVAGVAGLLVGFAGALAWSSRSSSGEVNVPEENKRLADAGKDVKQVDVFAEEMGISGTAISAPEDTVEKMDPAREHKLQEQSSSSRATQSSTATILPDSAAMQQLFTARRLLALLDSQLALKTLFLQERGAKILELEQKLYAMSSQENEEITTLKKQMETMRESLDDMDQDLKSMEEELVKGRMERESLKAKIIEAERAVVMAEDLRMELLAAERMQKTLEDQLENRDKLLEGSYNDQNELLKRCEASLSEVKRLESERDTLKMEQEQAKSALDETEHERAKLEEKLEIYRKQAESKVASLQSAVEDARTEHHDENLRRIAAEKALENAESVIKSLTSQLENAKVEQTALEQALEEEQRKVSVDLEDARLAMKDAKEALHREMEASAEVQRKEETIEALQEELSKSQEEIVSLKEALESAERKNSTDAKDGTSAASTGTRKRRGRPRKKNPESAESSDPPRLQHETSLDGNSPTAPKVENGPEDTSNSFDPAKQIVDVLPADISKEEMMVMLNRADAATAEAWAAVEKAERRSFEIRAEAALLVETVEDRAQEQVDKAEAEVNRLKQELKRWNRSSD